MITTYLSRNEFEKYSSVADAELNGLFQEIKSKFGNVYFLQERHVPVKRFLRKTTFKTYYCLYFRLKNIITNSDSEVQIINFSRDHEWSINTDVPKSYIMTYFFGMLNGATEIMRIKRKNII